MLNFQISESVWLSLATFMFGLFSAAYAVQVGKAFEMRKEILDKLRDWVDDILLDVNQRYQQDVLNSKNVEKDRVDNLLYGVKRKRWQGIVQGLQYPALSDELNLLESRIVNFDALFYHFENKRLSPQEFAQRKEDQEHRQKEMARLAVDIEKSIVRIHELITQDAVRLPFWMKKRRFSKVWLLVLGFLLIALIVLWIVLR